MKIATIVNQLFGLLLASTTALGCIAYERILSKYSWGIILVISLAFYCVAIISFRLITGNKLQNDLIDLYHDNEYSKWALLYFFTWITTPIWYIITKRQGIVTASLYDIKYIVVLAFIYIWLGKEKLTSDTIIGGCLALASIYFISKK